MSKKWGKNRGSSLRSALQYLLLLLVLSSSSFASAIPQDGLVFESRNFNGSFSHHPFGWPDRRFEAPLPGDTTDIIVDDWKEDNLFAMETKNLHGHRLAVLPWSDSYWPIYAGGIAARYADPEYKSLFDWKKNSDYLLAQLGKGATEQLSPAEKYDLLVGDRDFTLTKASIDDGSAYYASTGKVETWMGICHGWAPASFMEPRPEKAVRVLAADNRTELLFTPSDLKGLASLLWANAQFPTRFAAKRCNEKNPARTPDGRIIREECRDTNPATFHQTMVNQLGVNHRSIVLDVSFDYEVWNQPILGYFYSFRDLRTGQAVASLRDALVKVTDYPNDKRKDFRAPGTFYLIRVAMNIDYTLEQDPSPVLADDVSRDAHGNAFYEYELELNEQGKILGGEWISFQHPDFMWVPVQDAKPETIGDSYLDSEGDRTLWDGHSPVPENWRNYAATASQYKQPLHRIVEKLLDLASH